MIPACFASLPSPAPFKRPDGSDYLEVHHIIFLADEGPDTTENVAALCPSCHRECHHGKTHPNYRPNS